MALPEPQLQLLSWNVAGWKTTSQQIAKFEGGLLSFFARHHIDVLCLQETKLTASDLAGESKKTKLTASEAKALCADLAGYDTFWACNEGAGAQRQGLNGVATFARSGSVLRADSAPLGDAQLDAEGRCILTEHSDFVLFNVYVPNSAGGARLPFKMRWLQALRKAMQKARAAGKPVILVGDLNMKSRAADVHWSCRPVYHRSLFDLVASDSIDPEVKTAATAACGAWPTLRDALRAKEIQAFVTKNSGKEFKRWGPYVLTSSGERVRLGTPMESEECARGSFVIDGVGCQETGELIFGPGSEGAPFIMKAPDSLSCCDLIECLKRIAGVDLSRQAQKCLADAAGADPTPPPVQAWLRSMTHDDGMIDSFVALHPEAQERFTCWDQYKQNRYNGNIGSRIDFILVDSALFEKHARQGAELDAGGQSSRFAANSPEAAQYAAVLGGKSVPAGFEGFGMPTLEEDEYNAQFRPTAASGIVYTPPQLSDHVAVSLLLQGIHPAPAAPAGHVNDAATKRCQPHKKKKITDFFGKKRDTGAAALAPGSLEKRPALGAA